MSLPGFVAESCLATSGAEYRVSWSGAAVNRDTVVEPQVSQCSSTGFTYCDTFSHQLMCQYICQDCTGGVFPVCSQPYYWYVPCGSC